MNNFLHRNFINLTNKNIMKNKLHKLSAALLIALSLTACGGSDNDYPGPPLLVTDDGISTFSSSNLNYALSYLPLESISTAEAASLTFMREEEKLANNVYLQLANTWGSQSRVFANVAQSEASHTESIRQLLLRYTLADPAAGLADGVFVNQTLQQLYTTLMQQSSLSYVDALKASCAIEEIDILDLQTALVNTDNQDIKFVYNNLNVASRNHLRSFVKALTLVGITYVPQYLTAEAYQAIVSTPIERGN
jgi:hypothetical protein